jgi:Predicted thioesterase
MKWTEEYKINSHDTDVNGIVRASLILRYMQETANNHMWNIKPSYEDLRARDMVFVLTKIRISFYQPVHTHEKITVSTWACESKGVSFNRCYQIHRDGDLIAEAVSVWALVGLKERKIYRVTDVDLSGFGYEDMLELDMPARIRIPDDAALSLKGERSVEYSDIDVNGHVNNTNYPDLLCNYIPHEEMTQGRVISAGINFISDAKLGDVLKVYVGQSDGMYYFRTQKGDGATNIEAEIMIEKVKRKQW